MKLNQDCVRDLLLAIEEVALVNKTFSLHYYLENSNLKNLPYTEDELMYTASRLKDAGFIYAQPRSEFGYYYISSLTYDGHSFLDNIRDNKAWRMAKDKASEITSLSLTNLVELANLSVRQLIGLD